MVAPLCGIGSFSLINSKNVGSCSYSFLWVPVYRIKYRWEWNENWSTTWTGSLIQPKLPAESILTKTKSEFASVFGDEKGSSRASLTQLMKYYHHRLAISTGEITLESEFINELGNLKILGNWAHLPIPKGPWRNIDSIPWLGTITNSKFWGLVLYNPGAYILKRITEQNIDWTKC